jgi:predicted nucleic acid-binding protein
MSLIKVLFDTNVLAYAHNQASSNHIPSLRLLEMVFQNKIHGIIAEQNIINRTLSIAYKSSSNERKSFKASRCTKTNI